MKKFFKVSTLLLLLPALMFMSCKKDNADASYPTPAPTNAAVQAGDGSVTLSWTAPESENLNKGAAALKSVIYLDELLLTNFVLAALFLTAAGLLCATVCTG